MRGERQTRGGQFESRGCRVEKKGKRTDHGFAILLDLKRAFAVPDQKREIKQVLDRLRKVVRIGDESEKVHGSVLLHEQVANLREKQRLRCGSLGPLCRGDKVI